MGMKRKKRKEITEPMNLEIPEIQAPDFWNIKGRYSPAAMKRAEERKESDAGTR